MLPLTSANEREDLVISTDSAIKMPISEREPVRALSKKDCDINGQKPTVFTVRPLRSREMIKVINASGFSTSDGLVRAAEIGICSINQGDQVVSKAHELDEMIDSLHHSAVLAVGAWLIEKTSLPVDPSEPAESE
tara:strand:- start:149 stop:553 length:405 start_codon:yes stop_codon:yes gene_type:complete